MTERPRQRLTASNVNDSRTEILRFTARILAEHELRSIFVYMINTSGIDDGGHRPFLYHVRERAV